eukprot:gnl/Trimastix_PCT/798.p2 GENE.gnl/Trimastix_PCT/798~~gnl/Trimastix_PCT/798.p2  ORF type:complete len:242 (+),score=73.25 gnl/Trimastix_PCT/798:73-798(+)
MNEREVQKQIEHMRNFILLEAEEKAQEIKAQGEEDFNIKKLEIVEAEKAKIIREYERKGAQIEVSRRIDLSTKVNSLRFRVLECRDTLLNALVKDAKMKAAESVSDKARYSDILKSLIVEGLIELREDLIQIQCREEDATLVDGVLEAAAEEYRQKSNRACHMEVLRSHSLPAAPVEGSDARSCCGGVVLLCHNGRIKLNNTLDHRLELACAKMLPLIRQRLFPQRLDAISQDAEEETTEA